MCSLVGSVDFESTEKKSKTKTISRKTQLYPTPTQKLLFNRWFSASRWCFNKAKEIQDARKKAGEDYLSKYDLRSRVLSEASEFFGDIPYLVKAGAVLDYCEAQKTAIAKYKKTGEISEILFRSRKKSTQSCVIKPESVTKKGVYAKTAGELKTSEPLHTDGESVLKRENGKYFLHATVKTTEKVTCENQARIVAVDPGIRTFTTFYAGNVCGKVGEGDFSRITRLCICLDKLISRKAKSRNHRERRSINKAIQRHRAKIQNLIDELHKKTALFLIKNFDVILLPSFETKQMSDKTKRKIGRKSVRAMLTFSHYRFKQYLKYKAEVYGKKVLEVNEAYTSKTASWTGEVKNIGGNRYIKSQGVMVDRDINGARGIMLRALRASSIVAV
jgi:putative transposase